MVFMQSSLADLRGTPSRRPCPCSIQAAYHTEVLTRKAEGSKSLIRQFLSISLPTAQGCLLQRHELVPLFSQQVLKVQMQLATRPAGECVLPSCCRCLGVNSTELTERPCRVLQHRLWLQEVNRNMFARCFCSDTCPGLWFWFPLCIQSLLAADNPNRMSIMKSGTRRFRSQPGHLVTPFAAYQLDTAHKKGVSSSVRGTASNSCAPVCSLLAGTGEIQQQTEYQDAACSDWNRL
jgi:hypothetical protein